MTLIDCGLYIEFSRFFADDGFGYLHCIEHEQAKSSALRFIMEDL